MELHNLLGKPERALARLMTQSAARREEVDAMVPEPRPHLPPRPRHHAEQPVQPSRKLADIGSDL